MVIAWLALGGVVLAVLLLFLKWFAESDPRRLAGAVKWIAIFGISAVCLYLAATGRLGWAFFAATALAPWIMRGLRLRREARTFARMAGAPSGQASTVETRHLRMRLDHDSGEMDGDVLTGPFAGRRLTTMDLEDLLNLRRHVADDGASLQVLEAYLDRVHQDWRHEAGADKGPADEPGPAGRSQSGGTGSGGIMSREEAYAVLGLPPGASDQEIRDRHLKLIAQLHPDRGGSNYLAARVNEARRVLLGK